AKHIVAVFAHLESVCDGNACIALARQVRSSANWEKAPPLGHGHNERLLVTDPRTVTTAG
ncbi:MAG: hypothetical protein WA851_17355, partial [Xanthobacteraceae bacterium]